MKLYSYLGIIIVATCLFTMTECKEKQTECDWDPCPYDLECEENFAPENDGYSRTDYNDMDVYYNHFHCHVGTMEETARNEDTVMVSGWMYRLDLVGNWGYNDTTHHSPMNVQAGEADMFMLTGDSNQMDISEGVAFIGLYDEELLRKVRDHFDEYLHRKLYIKGTTHVEYSSACCATNLLVLTTYIDTIP